MTTSTTATPNGNNAKATNTQASHRMMQSFGAVASLLMKAERYRHYYLADLEWLAAPAVASGQFSIAEAQSKETGFTVPVACVIWAQVSDEVDQRLMKEARQPLRLRGDEWASGAVPWLVEAVGDPAAVGRLLEAVLKARFAKTGLKALRPGPDGKWTVQVLKPGMLTRTTKAADAMAGNQSKAG
ncbi:MAG: toxin-activating lysine-acyltransferase [Hyphomicrobiaceae bacterium]|nr:toxin-activating lysine-acyltransferase [Hyphomicrobiaceae bacterium]MCC0009707.1 toxin-activating lysine-acyltransferase [Hyphomicrobiaceae bacterium]